MSNESRVARNARRGRPTDRHVVQTESSASSEPASRQARRQRRGEGRCEPTPSWRMRMTTRAVVARHR